MTQVTVLPHLGRGWVLALAWALVAGPGAAWACRPDFHHIEEPTLFEGPDGEAYWKYEIYGVTGISGAYDLGAGFVVQHLIDGNACYAEIAIVVQDCATGEAVTLGGEMEAMSPGPRQEDILEQLNVHLEERAWSGPPLSIAEISATAAERGVGFVVPMGTTSLIRFGEFEFRLGEACQAYYPELAGGSSE